VEDESRSRELRIIPAQHEFELLALFNASLVALEGAFCL